VAEQAPRAGGESLSSDVSAVTTEPLDLLWAGSINGMEQALVERADIAFHGIDTGKLRGMDVPTMLRSIGKIISGVRQSLAILNKFRPHVCFVTGGYVCAPVVLACRIRRIPVLIYLPDIVPGLAIRGLSKLAARIAISFAQTAAYFGGEAPQGKAVVTGYPVRPALIEAVGGGQLDAAAHAQNRAAVRRQLAGRLQRPLADVERDGTMRPLILVWGGSQGSRTINQATWGALPHLLPAAHILHVVGQRDWPLLTEQQQTHPVALEWLHRYHPVAYLHEEMIPALVAADLTVARAGASSLGEFPYCSFARSISTPGRCQSVTECRVIGQPRRRGDCARCRTQRTISAHAAGAFARPGQTAGNGNVTSGFSPTRGSAYYCTGTL
jgi:UDP-N-acetylglucosamine--N-acetylmuramyl-(pentapeptide) pyrophosphoryl-undecaprenol N-acetylglucosamine transferase